MMSLAGEELRAVAEDVSCRFEKRPLIPKRREYALYE